MGAPEGNWEEAQGRFSSVPVRDAGPVPSGLFMKAVSLGNVQPILKPARQARVPLLPDRLPANDGCEVSPSCLDCPLEVCKYDHPAGARVGHFEERDRQIHQRRNEGASIDELVAEFNLVRRSVYRILETK